LLSATEGVNSTVFVYGQTGSGKTYTMFGPNWEHSLRGNMSTEYREQSLPEDSFCMERTERHGIIPRAIYRLFSELIEEGSEYSISCSFVQIYNEKLYDLLQDKKSEYPLAVREDKEIGMFIEGLMEYPVINMEECFVLLFTGEKNRIIRQTKLNMFSSRSHTIFQLLITNSKGEHTRRAKLNLCDLAGSEKVSSKIAISMKHLAELRSINLSLTTLGKVISALSTRTAHVPYRDSKLTKILKDSINGNARTCLIATISPTVDCIDESISTLTFANATKKVRINPVKNEIKITEDPKLKRLEQELQYMKDLLKFKRKGGISDLQKQIISLRQENTKLRSIYNSCQIEEMKRENNAMKAELQKIREQQLSNTGTSLEPSWKSDFQSNRPPFTIKKTFSSSSLDNAAGRIAQQRKLEDSFNTLNNNMATTCPICILPIPCTHYESKDEVKSTRRSLNELTRSVPKFEHNDIER